MVFTPRSSLFRAAASLLTASLLACGSTPGPVTGHDTAATGRATATTGDDVPATGHATAADESAADSIIAAEHPASPAPGLPAQPATITPGRTLAERLALAAPHVDPDVIALAVEARDCATLEGAVGDVDRLAVIDYSRPSTEPRLWVFDLSGATLLYAEHVAHGKYSGGNMTTAFSNVEGSLMSSLGLYSTGETYVGGNGYSLRMDGLEPGFNDHARERLIVMHGADYVDPAQARRQGRLGRSFGCPAVRDEIAQELIDSLKDGQLLFAYYPDSQWLEGSRFLGCSAAGGGTSVASKAAG